MSTTREELPARLRAAYSEALTLLRIGRAASAERVLRDIQAAAPGEINSLRLLGVALLDQDKASDALLALEQVTAAAPEFWAARADLARAYRRAGRLEQARRELSRTVSAAPALESTWLAYGGCLPKLAKSSGLESSGEPRGPPPSQNRTWSVTPSGSQPEPSTAGLGRGYGRFARVASEDRRPGGIEARSRCAADCAG
jgi:tetratricopeptide (TPR) repeat protein